MVAKLREYRPESDFIRIRDFLVHTYEQFGGMLNWRLERWNYARYFVAPMLGDPDPEKSAKNIHFWEKSIGVWEGEDARS